MDSVGHRFGAVAEYVGDDSTLAERSGPEQRLILTKM